MAIDEAKITTFQSICTVLLREVRVARGIHQAVLADNCGQAPTFWAKIESGKTKLDFETLLRVCKPIDVLPSAVIQTAERYKWALEHRGWSVVLAEISSADALMRHAQACWASPGYRFWSPMEWVGRTILDTPRAMNNGWHGLAAVFEFANSEDFRTMYLDEEHHRPFVGPRRPTDGI